MRPPLRGGGELCLPRGPPADAGGSARFSHRAYSMATPGGNGRVGAGEFGCKPQFAAGASSGSGGEKPRPERYSVGPAGAPNSGKRADFSAHGSCFAELVLPLELVVLCPDCRIFFQGYRRSTEQCKSKMHNLMTSYRRVKKGVDPESRCKFFAVIDQVGWCVSWHRSSGLF